MRYSLEIGEHLKKVFEKIKKKDVLQAEIIKRKINEILEKPEIGKPLTSDMAGQWRVHIRHYVLTYEIIEKEKIVRILDYVKNT
ncbi:MAG: type II toxin-antitoxin system mRNA interferase toxin, RelE/StbE family [archaeon]